MLLICIVLFLSTLVSGSLVLKNPNILQGFHKSTLAFSGSFLLSVTILHLLPEVFGCGDSIGSGVLLFGFLVPFINQFFRSKRSDDGGGLVTSLFIGLCVHAFFEGTILLEHSHGGHSHGGDGEESIMLAILLHKIPVVVSFITIAHERVSSKSVLFFMLLAFSLASPLGVFAGSFMHEHELLPHDTLHMIFAWVAGNFLFISISVLKEGLGDGEINGLRKLSFFMAGILVAILSVVFESWIQV